MPTYGYECTVCQERFEVFQRITEAPLTVHEGCGGAVRRLLYPVGIVFKGPGFYINDYARAGKNGASGKNGADKDGAEKSSAPENSAESKPEAKSEANAGA